MSVYKSPKSRFYHYDFQFRGRRYHGSTGCAGKRDAEQFEREERRKAALGQDTRQSITIDAATGLWYEKHGRHLANAATEFGQLVRLTERLGKLTLLGDVTIAMLDDYISRRRAEVKNATVNREITLLRRVIRYCGDRDYAVPDISWKALLLAESKERIRELSATEEKRLFAALDDNLRPIVEFALLSGQRKAEIINLRWQDVDLEGARAHTIAKGEAPHSFPLTPRMIAIITSQPRVLTTDRVFTYICERTAPVRIVNGRKLPRRYAGRRYPFSLQGWRRKWAAALKAAGIENYTFHDNRHTKATRTLRATGNLKAVQKLLNHADIRTTTRYAHALEDDIRNAMLASETRPAVEAVGDSPAPAPAASEASPVKGKRQKRA